MLNQLNYKGCSAIWVSSDPYRLKSSELYLENADLLICPYTTKRLRDMEETKLQYKSQVYNTVEYMNPQHCILDRYTNKTKPPRCSAMLKKQWLVGTVLSTKRLDSQSSVWLGIMFVCESMQGVYVWKDVLMITSYDSYMMETVHNGNISSSCASRSLTQPLYFTWILITTFYYKMIWP